MIGCLCGKPRLYVPADQWMLCVCHIAVNHKYIYELNQGSIYQSFKKTRMSLALLFARTNRIFICTHLRLLGFLLLNQSVLRYGK